MPPVVEHTLPLRPLPDSRQLLDAFAGCLLTRWDDLLRIRHQTLLCVDEEQIHDLRVASRRLRVALEPCGLLIGQGRMKRMLRPIRKLTRELGMLRNLDEALHYYTQVGTQQLQPLLTTLADRRSHEAAQARQLLTTLDCMKLERQIRTAAAAMTTPDNIGSQRLAALLSARNLQLYRRIHHLQPLAAAPQRIAERHALRIAIKKWRYFTELVDTMLGKERSEQLQLLRQYQSLLGAMNDREVFADLLREHLPPERSCRVELLARLHREQRQLFKKLCALLAAKPLIYHFEL